MKSGPVELSIKNVTISLYSKKNVKTLLGLLKFEVENVIKKISVNNNEFCHRISVQTFVLLIIN